MVPVVYLEYNFRNQSEEIEKGDKEIRKTNSGCKNEWVIYNILHTVTSKAQFSLGYTERCRI